MTPALRPEPRRGNRLPALLCALALGALCPSPAWAGEAAAAAKASDAKAEAENESKAARATLADKIPPVSGNVFYKQGRFEVAPAVGISLGDAFFQKYAFGLMINYHVMETVSVGLHGSYLLNTPGGAVNVCGSEGCRSPQMSDLDSVPGNVSVLAGLEVAWSPFYGKVNIMAEKVLHFDTSIFIGGDLIMYGAYDPKKQVNGVTVGGNAQTPTAGGHIGIGERVVFNDFLALRIELRDYMYAGKTLLDTEFQNQLMLEIGVSFFLGSGSRD